jgi:hypothetical protein
MSSLLDSLAPAYLGPGRRTDPLTGLSLDLQVYESDWDEPKLLVYATTASGDWRCVLALIALEQALEEAAQGVVSDLALAGSDGLVRPADNGIEVELGPFIVEGRRVDWQLALDRERADALPLSQLPQVTPAAWEGNRTPFPVASSE